MLYSKCPLPFQTVFLFFHLLIVENTPTCNVIIFYRNNTSTENYKHWRADNLRGSKTTKQVLTRKQWRQYFYYTTKHFFFLFNTFSFTAPPPYAKMLELAFNVRQWHFHIFFFLQRIRYEVNWLIHRLDCRLSKWIRLLIRL